MQRDEEHETQTAKAPLRVLSSRAMAGDTSIVDAELVRMILAGLHSSAPATQSLSGLAASNNAKEALFLRHAVRVANAVQRITRDAGDAEDIAQEAFFIAFDKIHQLGEPNAFFSWVTRIAMRRATRAQRKKRWYTFFATGTPENDVSDTFSSFVQPVNISPEDRAALSELDRALAGLPIEDRAAWLFRRAEGMRLEEAAEACGCSLATVKRRITRADAHVRQYIDFTPEEV